MCYPSLSNSKQGEESISKVKKTLTEKWPQNASVEFDAIFEEREIESKLDELDDLIIQAQQRQKNGENHELPYVSISNKLK